MLCAVPCCTLLFWIQCRPRVSTPNSAKQPHMLCHQGMSPGHFAVFSTRQTPLCMPPLTPVVCSQCVKILCCCVAVCGAGFPDVRAAFYICWSAVPHLLRCKSGCCLVAVLETHGAVPGHSAVHPGAYCASWQSQVCCAATNAGHSNSSNSETSIRFSVSARMLTSCTNRLTLHALSIHYIMDFDKNYCRLGFVRPH